MLEHLSPYQKKLFTQYNEFVAYQDPEETNVSTSAWRKKLREFRRKAGGGGSSSAQKPLATLPDGNTEPPADNSITQMVRVPAT